MKTLIQQWIDAKANEVIAAAERERIESLILQEIKAPEDGSKTHSQDGYKITATGRLNYRADMPHLMTLCGQLPENMRPIKTETVLDRTGAKFLRLNEPEIWSTIAPAIEVKPGKSSIKIEPIK